MVLNEFLRGFVNLLGTSGRLLRNTRRNTADSLGDRLGTLGYAGCRPGHSLTTRKRKLSSAGFACGRGAFFPSAGFAGSALAAATFAGRTFTASALSGSRLASRALAGRTFPASRLARR